MKNNMRKLPERYKAQSYCLNNSILIYPIPVSKTTWKLEVSYRGQKPIVSKEMYNKKQLNDKTWELYVHFYNKRDI